MNEFDNKALEWDKNAMHIERANAIAKAIIKMIPLSSGMTALEYGAGTGLLSFNLKDKLKSITLMDSSEEMIKILTEKIKATGAKNMQPLFFDLEKNSYTNIKFDFIFSSMVLHHIVNIEKMIAKCYQILNTGGILAIADLYKENGTFHDSSFTGHNGFDPEQLKTILTSNGFSKITYKPCYTINKANESGEIRKFPVFLMKAEKIR